MPKKALVLLSSCLIAACFLAIPADCHGASSLSKTQAKTIIIDTDIGSYIDDSFAIALALQSKEYLDIRLIVTCTDDTKMRARILAKLLTCAGHDDIPIGLGAENPNITNHTLWEWAEDYNLSNYRGGVYDFSETLDKMANIILSSTSTAEIIALGPMTNFPYLLQKYPQVAQNSRIRAMGGSIYRGYDNSTTPCAEYNIKLCPHCFDVVLRTTWSYPITLTPLDTSGVAYLMPGNVENFTSSSSRWVDPLDENMLFWCTKGVIPCHLNVATVALPDTVAFLLSLPNAEDFVEYKDLPLIVDSQGYTKVNSTAGVNTQVALNWKNGVEGLKNYQNFITSVLSKS